MIRKGARIVAACAIMASLFSFAPFFRGIHDRATGSTLFGWGAWLHFWPFMFTTLLAGILALALTVVILDWAMGD